METREVEDEEADADEEEGPAPSPPPFPPDAGAALLAKDGVGDAPFPEGGPPKVSPSTWADRDADESIESGVSPEEAEAGREGLRRGGMFVSGKRREAKAENHEDTIFHTFHFSSRPLSWYGGVRETVTRPG